MTDNVKRYIELITFDTREMIEKLKKDMVEAKD